MAAMEKHTAAKHHHLAAMRHIAQARKVDSFLAMDVLAAANQREAAGEATYHLEVGQPGAPTPQSVRDAISATLADGRIGYTEAAGTKALRQRIARHYADQYGQSVDPARVMVTTGSSASFSLAFLLLCDPGDRIALPRPGYPAYRNIVRALGLEPVEIDLDPDSGWVLTPEALAKHHDDVPIRAVLIASPNNPTGTVMPPQAIEKLASYCKQAGIWYISDEIYHGLVFDGEQCCALSFDEDAIIINSFSKYYCMTGWRIGWMILPERLVRGAEALAQNLFICAPSLSQTAALAAFDATDELETIKAGYAANRQRLLQTQEVLGLAGGPPPDGAFYMYWPVQTLLRPGETSVALCDSLLAETGIAITPGNDFDPVHGDGFVRVSFAGSQETISEAADLFEHWAKRRSNRL
ncbi:aminotransferase class I/II-fold pyridoxal phosphate-dependent enzyme [Ahrensia marina]|uniref:pyridoxal phosphate-dependent aminotransferase n=1 Tax=Ahrensia marina TaxID=1514904 RepID=UPI0035CF9E60